jgi:outer membrane protein OmpA-like peptidoglycan-associated protein
LDTRVVYFAPDSAVLIPATRRELRGLVDELRRSGVVTVTGFAADAGDPGDDVALDLSQRRAQRVAEFLAARGVSVSVESAQGKKLPVSTDRALNRRVEIAWYVPSA